MPLPALATGIALIDQLARLFRPVNSLIDDIHTSEEERARARSHLQSLQNEALALMLALERESLSAKANLIAAEAKGASWLQRNWRPITMLSFLGLVVADAFGLLAFRLADQAWLLLQIGLGGYVVGRSVEKISPQITPKQRTLHHPGREQAGAGHPGTDHPGAAPAATGQAGPGSDGYNHDAR